MKIQIKLNRKLLGICLGAILFIPLDSSFTPESGWYTSRHPDFLPEVFLFDISLSNHRTYPVGSRQLKDRLSQLHSRSSHQLISQVEDLYETLKPSQGKERLRLTRIARIIGSISTSARINHLLIDQAEKYATSKDPIDSEVSRLALEYYIELEPESSMKQGRIRQVTDSIIQSNYPLETGRCQVIDFFNSRPECENKSKQPCHLVVLKHDSQAIVCWKPGFMESKDMNPRKNIS